jgi:hypothetical protein
MIDPRTDYVPPDPTVIDAGSSAALHYWSMTLETEPEKIHRAVKKVGPLLEDVKAELGIGGVG